jgi:hypothetical protein
MCKDPYDTPPVGKNTLLEHKGFDKKATYHGSFQQDRQKLCLPAMVA